MSFHPENMSLMSFGHIKVLLKHVFACARCLFFMSSQAGVEVCMVSQGAMLKEV